MIAPRSDLAFLCQQSALLDNPIDEPLEVSARTRAGAVNPRVAKNLLNAARCGFGEAEFASLNALRLLDERDIIDPNTGKQTGTDFGFGEINGVARAARSIAALDPSQAGGIHTFLSNLVGKSGVTYAQTLNGLGFDPADMGTVLRRDGFDRLLEARADIDRAALWPVVETLVVADTVCQLALGVAEKVANQTDQQDPVTGTNPTSAELEGNPLFIGPDGVKNNADDLPFVMCPPGASPETRDFGSGPERFAGSRCVSDFDGTLVEPLYYLVPDPGTTPADTSSPGLLDLSGPNPEQTCRGEVAIENGGLNVNGECISLSTNYRIGLFNAPLDGIQRQTIAAKEFLQDPAFRPATAILEPTNLTDLRLRASGATIPARPHPPGGGLIFPNPGPFSRRVDPGSGAPVRSSGPLECTYRVDGAGNRVGPDGLAATLTDNDIASLGNCLLFDNPGPSGVSDDGLGLQFVRTPDAISSSHSANQGLFAKLCTQSFDEDNGQCALDFFNHSKEFQPLADALSGRPGISGLLVLGYDSVRLISNDPNVYFNEVGKAVFSRDIFTSTNSFGGVSDFSSQLSSEQEALLGCGPALGTPCDFSEILEIIFSVPSSAFRQALGLTDDRIPLVGGIDLENAEARVLIQEFLLRRNAAAGSLVGDASGDRFEAGISYGAEVLGAAAITPSEAIALGLDATRVVRDQIAAELFNLGRISAPSVAEMDALIDVAVGNPRQTLRQELNLTATDFQVEPTRWIHDPSAPNLRFLPPDVGPDGIAGTPDDDYFDPVGNPGGTIDPLGENCSPRFGGPEPSCTAFEMISSNLERTLIAGEIIGPAAVPDPYETFAEWVAMGDGDPSNDLVADPISGPDGIVFNDFDRNGDGRISHDSLDVDQRAIVANRGLAADSFANCAANAPDVTFCHLNLDTSRPLTTPVNIEIEEVPARPRLIAALPIGMRLSVGTIDITLANDPRKLVPIQGLSPFELQQLETFDQVTVEGSKIGEPAGDVTLFRTFIDRRLPPGKQIIRELGSLLALDQDGGASTTRVRDLDQDGDGALDFVDDGTPGPGALGNFKCGSGVPGDVLQDAQQIDFDGVELAKLAASGMVLPPRSPEFCASLVQFLDLTGPTRDGRRAFLWQGALPEERMDRDADGDVDLNDLQEIVDARNTAAASADDPLDLDGDGQITVLDGRKAALLCTRAGCADETGAAPASLEEFLSGAAPTLVPTLSREGLLLLSLLLLIGVAALRRRRFRT